MLGSSGLLLFVEDILYPYDSIDMMGVFAGHSHAANPVNRVIQRCHLIRIPDW